MTPLADRFEWRKVNQFPMRSWDRVIGCALFSLVLLSCHLSRAPKSDEDSKQALLALENRWLQVEDDPVALEGILAHDFLHVVPGAIITKDQHLQFLREHPAGTQRAEKHFADLHVRVYGEAGIVNGAVIQTTEHGEHKTLFTDVFAYRDGKWQAVSAQELPLTGP
ncbi:MAG: hypothetical protein DME55_07950 [Verrucomicrobia bacterium]|nr:MAG: hypothetical protein DME55_07950 [Verrucomicrobiota bacterium]